MTRGYSCRAGTDVFVLLCIKVRESYREGGASKQTMQLNRVKHKSKKIYDAGKQEVLHGEIDSK